MANLQLGGIFEFFACFWVPGAPFVEPVIGGFGSLVARILALRCWAASGSCAFAFR